jgi:hypothetical protein
MTPSQTSPLFNPPIESPVCPSKTFSYPGLTQLNSVIKYLQKLHAFKEFRNALKGPDYDIVKLLRVDFFLPIFNVDVVFELPPMGSSIGNLQAKLMVGMDKQHNGHATQWTCIDQFYYITHQE